MGLVSLVLANDQIHPLRYEGDIGTVKRTQRRPAKAASEPDEQQRPVTQTGEVIRQGLEHGAERIERRRLGLARARTLDTADAVHDLAHIWIGGGCHTATDQVSVANGREPPLHSRGLGDIGEGGEIGCDGLWAGRQLLIPTAAAPADEILPVGAICVLGGRRLGVDGVGRRLAVVFCPSQIICDIGDDIGHGLPQILKKLRSIIGAYQA